MACGYAYISQNKRRTDNGQSLYFNINIIFQKEQPGNASSHVSTSPILKWQVFLYTLKTKNGKNCTFSGRTACHWDSVTKGTIKTSTLALYFDSPL